MDLFLLHSLILIWASLGAARRLTPRVADQLLASALLAWSNIVATSLFLSTLHRLGDPAWFLGASAGIALLVCLIIMIQPEATGNFSSEGTDEAGPHPWLQGAFILTLAPVACASAAVAYFYGPNNSDSLTYHLPRSMYYLGQGNLAHFAAADPRQIYLPFNYNLLQLFGFIYDPPLQCLNFFNLAAWAVGGIAVYRLCRLSAFGANTSLIACWLVLTATPMLAQAATTTPDLPVGAAFLCGLVFALRWKQTEQTRYAMLSSLAVGLSVGSDLGALLFFLVAALPLLVWQYRHWWTKGGKSLRAWSIPVVLTCAIILPFALINLAEKGAAIRQIIDLAFHKPVAETSHETALGFLPLMRNPPPLLVLNEDLVGFGFTGPLFLLGAAFCLITCRKSATPATWSVRLGLGWIATSLLLLPCLSSDPRNFVPALLLLSPGVAAVIEAGHRRPVARYIGYLTLLLVALVASWSDGIYLLWNSNRPLEPLLQGAFVAPGLPSLPLLLEHHLSGQTRINIDTDGTNERIFPLMALGRSQRFTSKSKSDPDAYRLLSRSSHSRNSDYQNLARLSSHSFVPIPAKRTAGVEFLATIGRDASARDYFGIEPHAGSIAPVDSNRFLLVTLSAAPRQSEESAQTHIKLEGLNPEDQARLAVILEYDDGSTVPLAAFSADGEANLTIPRRPFHRLVLRAQDAKSGAEIGVGAIPYLPQMSTAYKPVDPSLPSNGRSIFVTEMVLSRDTKVIAGEGLLPTEGPFPQWDLPHIRWARRASISLTIPPTPELASLQLSFSLRLHVRAKADVEVLFNGKSVQHYRIENRTTWLDQTLNLTPRQGENIVEFRDVSLKNEPDWRDYLERYPDVMKHLVTHNIPLEQGAREHYERHGRAEGRTLQMIEMPALAPDSYYFMFRNIRLEGFKSP